MSVYKYPDKISSFNSEGARLTLVSSTRLSAQAYVRLYFVNLEHKLIRLSLSIIWTLASLLQIRKH